MWYCIIVTESNHQEEITILITFIPNNRALKSEAIN